VPYPADAGIHPPPGAVLPDVLHVEQRGRPAVRTTGRPSSGRALAEAPHEQIRDPWHT